MRYLFVLNHALYLRNYGAVLHALAEAGHDVDIAFTVPRPGDPELFDRVFHGRPSVRLIDAPQRTGWWWAALDPMRALRDYLHYQHPAFDETPKLVERAARRVPGVAKALIGKRGRHGWRKRTIERLLVAIERSVRPDPAINAWLERYRPDALLVSPLIEFRYDQLHILKAACAAGIPTAHLVASWDNLSNKGRIQIASDMCLVWNGFQKREAVTLHRLPADRIVVTGAQLYDSWFAMAVKRDRAALCAELGFDPARPILLYACSSSFICENEVGAVKHWLKAVRASANKDVAAAQIIIRPHPANAGQWKRTDLSVFGAAKIAPENGATTIEEPERQFLFDCLSHSAAVIGINTSVFLEAGIVGRPCLTIETEASSDAQNGTLHFRYLADGGLLHVANTMEVHLEALAEAVHQPEASTAAKGFIAAFLRPAGLDQPALPEALAAIERLPKTRTAPQRPQWYAPLLRALVFPVAALYLRPRYLARRARREGIDAAIPQTSSDGRS